MGRLRQRPGKQALGRGSTGGHTAVPTVEPIQATWNLYGPKTPLPPPSAEAARRLKALPIDYASGQRLAANSQNGFTEYFKLDANKKVRDTQYSLAGRSSLARGEPRPGMAWQAVLGPVPGPTLSRSGGNMRSHPRAGGGRRRIECRKTCVSCWVCEPPRTQIGPGVVGILSEAR